jgi:sulfite reductase (ferredoxin)
MKFYELPDILEEEIRQFDGQIKEYLSGEINPVQFKGIRVAHGIYEQRKPETHMVRIRCAAGGVTSAQLRKVGELAQKYGSSEVHVTTRQEMQIHYVKLEDVVTVYNELYSVGLSSRGGGGNTVRNVLASYSSGVIPDEVFDVAPYAIALTTRMIAEADSWNLPRKFKIAFSNNDKDSSRAAVTCLGFIAKMQGKQRGFKVYCAGGQGAKPMLGQVLLDFVEDDKVYHITKAIKVMFDKYGNRRNRTKSKLKFLWDKLGKEDFLQKFHREYDELIKDMSLVLQLLPLENRADVKEGYLPELVTGESYDLWKKRYVKAQKQEGLYMIKVPLKLGDIEGVDSVKIANELEHFGENVLRFSLDQNLHFRNIPKAYLGNLFNLVQSIKSLSNDPELFGNMIACTGADTCKLGICLPRGLTPNIQDILRESDLNLDLLDDVKIHISGCPNTCGCHHVADLGFFGKVVRQGKDMMPGYHILAGAIVDEGKTRFSLKIDTLAAKDLPHFVKDFFTVYTAKKNKYKTFAEYVDAEGQDDIKNICENYRDLPTRDENQDYYHDWGSKEIFSLLKGQKAECSAGMFDMVDVDVKMLKESRMNFEAVEDAQVKSESLYRVAFSAARMLLVTRGIECKTDEKVFEAFIQYFIKTDLVPEEYTQVVLWAGEKEISRLMSHVDQVMALADVVLDLYKSMDDSLRFMDANGNVLGEKDLEAGDKKEVNDSSAERFKDLRGVGCPMNFVKLKIELVSMASGEKIAVLLDDGEPVANVPGSVKNEGHTILKLEQQGTHWMLLIRKV